MGIHNLTFSPRQSPAPKQRLCIVILSGQLKPTVKASIFFFYVYGSNLPCLNLKGTILIRMAEYILTFSLGA